MNFYPQQIFYNRVELEKHFSVYICGICSDCEILKRAVMSQWGLAIVSVGSAYLLESAEVTDSFPVICQIPFPVKHTFKPCNVNTI